MKANVYDRDGPPDVLRLEDVERPTPGGDQALIKVVAAAVNPFEWHFMRGTPYVARTMMGLRRPRDRRLGIDVSGVVEAVGGNVTQFKPSAASCCASGVADLEPAAIL